MINLIGVSGYAGSGKSTLGEIIQYIMSESFLKRTFKEFISKGQGNNDFQQWYNSEWEIKGFSVKLKEIASILTGIPAYKFDNQEFKKTFLNKEWNFNSGTTRMQVRVFLQQLGTDAIRDVIHENTWVNALFADYKPPMTYNNMKTAIGNAFWEKETGIHQEIENHPKWIITDCRFPNEAQAIKDRGGIVIRVNRHVPKPDSGEKMLLHPSEISLNLWPFDYTINNNGTIEELIEKTREMLIHFKIVENGKKEDI